MSRRQITLLGDSLTQGTGITGTSSTYGEGGKGSWWELVRDALADINGVGPLLSAGVRPTSLGYVGNNPTEWTFAGTHTAVLSTDGFDKVPYGGSGIQGFRWGNGITVTDSWAKQNWMPPIIAADIDMIDMVGGGDIQYAIDGGAWTNINQTSFALHNNTWLRFRINKSITSTIAFRAYDGSVGVNMLMIAVDPIFSTASEGLVVNNFAINGSKLHELTLSTSGDRLACLDSIRLGGGNPVYPYANVCIINENVNDVLLSNATQYGTDQTTLKSRIPLTVAYGVINPWECNPASYNTTQQTSYRAKGKLAAPGKYLDLYDEWSSNGWTGNAAAVSAKLIAGGADLTHETQSGHLDIAPRVYWFIRTKFLPQVGQNRNGFTLASSKLGSTQILGGAPLAPFRMAFSPLGAADVLGGDPKFTQYVSASRGVGVVAGTPTLKPTNTIAQTGEVVSVVKGTINLKPTNTLLASGKSILLTPGNETLFPGPVNLSPHGVVISTILGTEILKPSNIIQASKNITVTEGTPTFTGLARLLLSGKVINVNLGTISLYSNTKISGPGQAIIVTGAAIPHLPNVIPIIGTGMEVLLATSQTTLRSTSTISPSGKVISLVSGSSILTPKNNIITSSVPIIISEGQITTYLAKMLGITGKTIHLNVGSSRPITFILYNLTPPLQLQLLSNGINKVDIIPG